MTALPNISSKNIGHLGPVERGSFVIMKRTVKKKFKGFYVGEVLDLSLKGSSGRYGSTPSATSFAALSFLSLRVYLPLSIVSHSVFFFPFSA